MPRLLTAYRVISYVTGVGLLVLVLLGVPLKYAGDNDSVVAVVGPLHGFLYMIYVVIALAMAYSRRWTILRTLVALIAGTIPFAVFFVEHRVVAEERTAPPVADAPQDDPARP